MPNRWRVRLKGADGVALAWMAEDLQRPEAAVLRDGDSYYLESTELESLSEPADVYLRVQPILQALSGASRAYGYSHLPVEPDGVVDTHDPHRRTHVFGAMAIITSSRVRARASGGKPVGRGLPNIASAMDHALRSGKVGTALRLFGRQANWHDLYKVAELIKHDVGRGNALFDRGWVSRSQYENLTQTANSDEAIGDASRHARGYRAPETPMQLTEAQELVGRLLQTWLLWIEQERPDEVPAAGRTRHPAGTLGGTS